MNKSWPIMFIFHTSIPVASLRGSGAGGRWPAPGVTISGWHHSGWHHIIRWNLNVTNLWWISFFFFFISLFGPFPHLVRDFAAKTFLSLNTFGPKTHSFCSEDLFFLFLSSSVFGPKKGATTKSRPRCTILSNATDLHPPILAKLQVKLKWEIFTQWN